MKRRLALIAAIALVGVACSAPTAEELVRQVIQQRNAYDATLSSWIVRDDAAIPYLYLDVMVVNNNAEATLRTLTVMVEQLDADNNVITSSRAGIDVASFTPGMGQSVGVTVAPAADGVEGVRLFVETNPPEDVWREFKEFDAVRPRV